MQRFKIKTIFMIFEKYINLPKILHIQSVVPFCDTQMSILEAPTLLAFSQWIRLLYVYLSAIYNHACMYTNKISLLKPYSYTTTALNCKVCSRPYTECMPSACSLKARLACMLAHTDVQTQGPNMLLNQEHLLLYTSKVHINRIRLMFITRFRRTATLLLTQKTLEVCFM